LEVKRGKFIKGGTNSGKKREKQKKKQFLNREQHGGTRKSPGPYYEGREEQTTIHKAEANSRHRFKGLSTGEGGGGPARIGILPGSGKKRRTTYLKEKTEERYGLSTEGDVKGKRPSILKTNATSFKKNHGKYGGERGGTIIKKKKKKKTEWPI